MAHISTLVKDIENVLLNGADVTEEQTAEFGQLVARTMADRLNEKKREFTLRLSNIGHPCTRKLWLDKHRPEGKEPLRASTKLKFLSGDLWELLLIFLAKISGHEVKDQQKERRLHGIVGHSDCTIDGELVDAKSASSYSFTKFKSHLTPEGDAFGYLGQLGGYHKSALDDEGVSNKDRAHFLVVDKQHGHITLDTHEFDHDEIDWESSVLERVDTVSNPDVIPPRAFAPIPDGYKNKNTGEFVPNGNEKLPINCSYCDQKFNCHENIRIFLSSRGPQFFTKVVKEPKMTEITRQQHETGTEEEPANES